MTENILCSGCKKSITNDRGNVKFACPSCGKSQIVRCVHCRGIAAKYKCAACEFEGPN